MAEVISGSVSVVIRHMPRPLDRMDFCASLCSAMILHIYVMPAADFVGKCSKCRKKQYQGAIEDCGCGQWINLRITHLSDSKATEKQLDFCGYVASKEHEHHLRGVEFNRRDTGAADVLQWVSGTVDFTTNEILVAPCPISDEKLRQIGFTTMMATVLSCQD